MKNVKGQETEIKLRVEGPEQIKRIIVTKGGRLIKSVHQKSLLFDAPFAKFDERGQALRLQIETDGKGISRSVFGFKGTPITNAQGHRSRPEYETEVENPESLIKILEAVGFYIALVLEKDRDLYNIGGVEIALDKFDFGTFVEIEGPPSQIEAVREKLGLAGAKPITKGYIHLWAEAKGVDLKNLKRY